MSNCYSIVLIVNLGDEPELEGELASYRLGQIHTEECTGRLHKVI